MPHEFELSDFGLRLIKAYEGFRPVETTLVSGQRVIGYGHRYGHDEEPVITQRKAEEILKTDLEPYIALVNDNVFAPLSQSQFDALVSLAFNIGPKAFLGSRTLHALNQGRPLDAANGFDEWRKSAINGQVYVVDALVRRRTAEKSLFLRPSGAVAPAPRVELKPHNDASAADVNADIPYFDKSDADGIVDQTPYNAKPAKYRRKEDGPAGVLTLSERFNEDLPESPHEETTHSDTAGENTLDESREQDLSPIAVAAREVSDRLDKLMAEPAPKRESASIEETVKAETETVLEQLVAANEGTEDDYARPPERTKPVVRGPEAFIQKGQTKAPQSSTDESAAAYWMTLFVGLAMLGIGAFKWLIETPNTLQGWTAFAAPTATILGVLLVLAALYYLIKSASR